MLGSAGDAADLMAAVTEAVAARHIAQSEAAEVAKVRGVYKGRKPSIDAALPSIGG
jgi:hypothetical protein